MILTIAEAAALEEVACPLGVSVGPVFTWSGGVTGHTLKVINGCPKD